MDDVFVIVAVLGAFLAFVVAPIVLALVAWFRVRALERSLAALRRDLQDLAAELRARPASAPAAPRAAAPEPAAAPPTPATLRPEPVSAPAPAQPAPAPPTPVEPAHGVPPPSVLDRLRSRPPRRGQAEQLGKRAVDLGARMRAIHWERWIGVRGAAYFGGLLLALAAILFFRHAFTQGWISPPLRVAAGVAAGLACIGAGWKLRARGYGFAPSALEGGGIVALYAAIWAADKRYQLISVAASFPLMALVTALACALALRQRSLFTALLGLLGGFATPLLLSSGQDRPFTFFGYVLLLDLGLVFVGRRRRWPSIGLLALVGTFLMESLWIFGRMGERLGLGLAIVGVFVLVFTFAGGTPGADEGRGWRWTRVLAVLFPFVFALYFAGSLELRGHVWPTALLLLLLTLSATVLSRLQGATWLPHGAAAGCVAVIGMWLFQIGRPKDPELWELALVASGLALAAHAGAEWEARAKGGRARVREENLESTGPDPSRSSHAPGWAGGGGWGGREPLIESAALAGAGWLALLVIAAGLSRGATLAPVFFGLVALALIVCRQASLDGRGGGIVLAGLGLGGGLGLFHVAHAAPSAEALPDARFFLALPAVLAAAFLFLLPRVAPARARAYGHACGLLLVAFALFLPFHRSFEAHDPWLLPAAAAAYAALLVLAAARLATPPWLALAVFQGAYLVVPWTFVWIRTPRSEEDLLLALGLVLAAGAVLVLLPALLAGRFEARAAASERPGLAARLGRVPCWWAVALVAVLWLAPLQELIEERFGPSPELVPYLLLAPLFVVATLRIHIATAARTPLGWTSAAVAFLLAAGIADQLDHAELAVGAALWALGLAAIARRLALPVAGWTAVLLAAFATARLTANALEPYVYARSPRMLWNALSYVHLVSALALGLVGLLLRGLPQGPRAPLRLRPLFTGTGGLCAIVILFLWINLEIQNHYAPGERLILGDELGDAAVQHARDLVTSLAWGVYAIVLLVLGTWRSVSALRWASLALFVLAIGKVFLYDLGHLEGLYRVGSLAGLALSLIAVSLFYQRFVFRRMPAAAT